jgi:ribulokinase
MTVYVIGVDGGTEGLRAGVFDLQGKPLAFASSAYPTRFPQPGWAEQDPRDWWEALGKAVPQALQESGIDRKQVAGLCVDTTCCSVVALDRDGHPVHPALIWMDMRSAPQTERVLATQEAALRVNSDGAGPVSAEWMIPKALWLKENQAAVFARAEHICEFQDYLNFHLTGRMVASVNNAAVRWHYDAHRGGYPRSLLAKLGLSELCAKWPQEVLPLGAMVGGLTARAATHLGLSPGLPVLQGGADAFVGMIGLGVVHPGSLAFITGSSHLHLGLSEQPFHGTGIWGTYADALLPKLYVVEGGQTSTGSVVNWLKQLFGEADYAALNAEASQLPVGSEGVLVQEHFQGNRTPHTDPLSRGAISGLTLKHGKAHLFRAAIEGIAFGTELILETMRHNGFTPQQVAIAGGATRSELWLQVHADVSNLPLTLTEVTDAPTLGCAILAATGSGHYPDVPTAVQHMVQVSRVVEPNAAAHAAYRPFYESYRAHYYALKQARQALATAE